MNINTPTPTFAKQYQQIFNGLSDEEKQHALGPMPVGFKREIFAVFCSLPAKIQSQILRCRERPKRDRSAQAENTALGEAVRREPKPKRTYRFKTRNPEELFTPRLKGNPDDHQNETQRPARHPTRN